MSKVARLLRFCAICQWHAWSLGQQRNHYALRSTPAEFEFPPTYFQRADENGRSSICLEKRVATQIGVKKSMFSRTMEVAQGALASSCLTRVQNSKCSILILSLVQFQFAASIALFPNGSRSTCLYEFSNMEKCVNLAINRSLSSATFLDSSDVPGTTHTHIHSPRLKSLKDRRGQNCSNNPLAQSENHKDMVSSQNSRLGVFKHIVIVYLASKRCTSHGGPRTH